MKPSLTPTILLSLSALGLAAPTAPLQNRAVTASITLYTETDYLGTSYTIPFTIDGLTCVAPTLPANIDMQASSVMLSATGEGSGFSCRLSS